MIRSHWLYQQVAKPTDFPSAPTLPDQPDSPQEQPYRNLALRIRRAALIAALPFFFFDPNIPAAQAFTDQPQDAVSQPSRSRKARAYETSFFVADPATVQFTGQPQDAVSQPSRWRKARSYESFFFVADPATVQFTGQPQDGVSQPRAGRRRPSAGPTFFFQENPVAAAFTGQPADQTQQPNLRSSRRARVYPSVFFQDAPAPPSLADLPADQIEHLRRPRPNRQHLYLDAGMRPVGIPPGTMPGVAQPGGPGTTIFVYNDAAAGAGGDGSYSIADVKAAMDIINPGQSDIEYMVGAVSGLNFSNNRRQYLVSALITWGGQGSDGFAPTTWRDTNVDIFFRGSGGFTYRVGGGPILTKLGNKVGLGPVGTQPATMGGTDGVGLYTLGNMVFRNDLEIYGNTFESVSGNVQFSNTGATSQEVAGNLIRAATSNSVLGTNATVGRHYNNIYVFRTASGAAINGILMEDMDGNLFIGITPTQFFSGVSSSARIKRVRIAGSPTVSDIRPTLTNYADWKISDIGWTNAAPRFSFAGDQSPDNGAEQYAPFNTKICGPTGLPLINIPVRLVSDIGSDGSLDTKTFGDGDVGFGLTQFLANQILVRDHFRAAGVTSFRDRTFTLYTNVEGGAHPRNPAYKRKIHVFQWPGKDILNGAYQADGGTFTACIMPVTLELADGPTASFGASPGGGQSPLTVDFTDESFPGDEPITAWAWDFGDGGTSTLQDPSHVYAVDGLYTVVLTVTTAVGQSTKTRVDLISIGGTQSSPTPTLLAPFFEEEDIPAMLEGSGQDVSVGATVVKGLFQERSIPLYDRDGSQLIAKVPLVDVKTGSLPGLEIGVELSTDGRTFKVWKILQIEDGALQEAYLQEVV